MRKSEVKLAKLKEFARGAATVFVGVMVLTAPVLLGFKEAAAEECVPTAVITSEGETGQFCDKGENDGGIIQLLLIVADIMTAGVGVLGVIGVTWAGIQYLTAGGSEEKARTAKRRIYEIVIGLIAYILIYVILRWLLPGFGA